MESGLGRGVQRRFRQGVARSLGGAGAVKFGDSFRGHSHHLWVLDQTPLGLEAEVGCKGALRANPSPEQGRTAARQGQLLPGEGESSLSWWVEDLSDALQL